MLRTLFEAVCLVPVIGGSIYAILSLISVIWFKTTSASLPRPSPVSWPPATILKPVCGLEKNLRKNLCSACVLTVFLWAGNAGAETMTHQSYGIAHPAGSASEAEELAYSLFMHHSSGVALIVLGVLVLTDRLTNRRYGALRMGISVVWLAFGAHLFIRSDPEGWPIGPAGLLESFSMPTAGEWMQHKLLSLISVALGIWTFTPRYRLPNLYWTYALGGLMALGGGALLLHQHADHPEMDLVNLQHRFMALTALFSALGMLADGWEGLKWKVKPLLLPCGLILLGFQLALYVE